MKVFRRFWPYFQALHGLRSRFALALVLGLVYGIATGGAIPFLIERVYPVVFAEGAAAPSRLLLFCLLPVLVMLARALAGFGNTYLLNYCGQHLLEHLRARVFDTMQRLPLAYFQKNRPGALISRAMQDTQLLRDGLSQFAQDVVKQPVTLLAAIGVLIYLTLKHREVGYLLLFILSVPVVIVPLRYFGKKVAKRAEAMLRQQDELTQQLSQNLGALYEIRAFNLQERESRRFSEQCREFTRRFLRVVLSANLISPAVEVVAAVAVGIALYYSAQGSIPQEAFLALLMALYLCYEPVKMIGRLHARVQQSLTALDRIEGVLQHPPDLSDPAEPKPWREPQGEVRFENVTFAYADASVLRGVDVTIPPGQTVALVGPSGAGKTTFCNLIPRFFDVGEGSVRVDGIDVREMAQAILREHIAIVPQEPTLFHDTIANNIRVGRLDATEAEVREAAKRAHADAFISEFEAGYETVCGERGGRLSGGQRQRIALARAFLRDARILILDEATSALDAESEVLIQKALEDLCRGKTVFIIAHRFSSIRHADRVLVFDRGEVVESGTHEELLADKGLYARLYWAQTRTEQA